MRGVRQKISLHDKLHDLGVKLVYLSFRCTGVVRLTSLKGIAQVGNRRAFPCGDHVRMHAILLRQLCERHLFADRFTHKLGFEFRCVVLSPSHSGSSLSSRDAH